MTTGALTDSLRETLAVFDGSGVPRTTPEVADRLDLGRRSTYNRLERLVEHGRLETKKVGANARVWWRPSETPDAPVPDWSAAADSLVNDVLDNIEVGIFVLDEDFDVAWINAATERFFGLDRERVLGRNKRRLIDERIASVVEDTDAFMETVLATYDDNTYTEQFECRVMAGDEREGRWLKHRSKPIEAGAYAGGRVELYYDVTERYEAQAHRLERQQDPLVDEVFARIDEAFFGLDEDWRFTYVNDRAADLVRLPPGELVGAKIWDVLHELAESEPRAVAERAMETQEPFEIEFYSELLDIWLEIRGYPSETGLSAYVRDVTERKERELELERYEATVETLWDGVATLDDDDRFVMVNEAFCEMAGYDREELLGEPVTRIHSEDINEEADKLNKAVRTGELEAATLEFDLQTADGDAIPVEGRFGPYEYADGTSGRTGVVRDITDRKRFEETLVRLYESTEALFDAETAEAVDDAIVEAVADVIDLPDVAVYRHDDGGDELYPAAHSVEDGFIRGGELPAVPPDDSSITGHVYASGEIHGLDDITESPYFQSYATEMRGGIFVPMGEHGVLIAGTPEEGGIDDARRLVELLAATAESAYDRVERERALDESEQRYRTLVENFPNGMVALFDEDLEYTFLKGTLFQELGVDPARFEGQSVGAPVDDMESRARLQERIRRVFSGETDAFEFQWGERIVQMRVLPLTDEKGEVFAGMAMSQDITERREDELELERQREQLAALNNLNNTVRDITEAVIDQSTREEIEATVCERLAESDSYEFAWIAEVDPHSKSITPRVEAGVDGYLEGISLSTNPDEPVGRGPAGRAFRTGETQVTQNALSDPDFEPWREHARTYGYRSAAGIPIIHDGTLYGLLGVYADRPKAFESQEQEVIGQLGEIVGHAIAAIERKQALTSDEITELEFTIPDIAGMAGMDMDIDGTITFERAVPAGDGVYIEYGTVDVSAIDALESLVDHLSHFQEVTILDRKAGSAEFELRLSEPPVVSAVASRGGYLDQAMIENGDFHLAIHLPVAVEARRIIDAIEDAYPTAYLLRRRQITRSDDTLSRVYQAVAGGLTDRQRTTLEAAYHAGFFEWPRDATGEEVAESLGIAPSTFSQHLRKGQQQVFGSLFSAPTPA